MGFWSDAERREAARARFEERMAIPIMVAAVLLTALTLVLLFADVPRRARLGLLAVDLALWVFFIVDYTVRFVLSPAKRRFVREEWLDGLLTVLPLLQPLRVLSAFLRLARLSAALQRTNQTAKRLVGRHKLYLAFGWAAGLVLTAAVVVPIVEPDKSKIKGFGDGIWWAIVTTTTVGYGDLVPESAVGRTVALVLMLLGISIIGLLTANIASLFLEADAPDKEHEPVSVEARLAELDRKLDIVMRRLDDL